MWKSLKNYSGPLIIAGIVLLVCVFAGISYAYWQLTLEQEGVNVVNTDCFELTFSGENDINLQKAHPITNEDGAALTPYTFTITNKCENTVGYQINLESLNLADKVLADEYIRTSLNEVGSSDKSIRDLTSEYEVTPSITDATSAYTLGEGTLTALQSKPYELRIWLGYETPPVSEAMSAVYNGKVSVVATYLDEN